MGESLLQSQFGPRAEKFYEGSLRKLRVAGCELRANAGLRPETVLPLLARNSLLATRNFLHDLLHFHLIIEYPSPFHLPQSAAHLGVVDELHVAEAIQLDDRAAGAKLHHQSFLPRLAGVDGEGGVVDRLYRRNC